MRRLAAILRSALLLMILGLPAWQAAAAPAELLAVINRIRARGCDDRPGAASPLRAEPLLDHVAQAMASGHHLRAAMKTSSYRAERSTSLELSGSAAAMEDWLARAGCEEIADPGFRDIGIAQAGRSAWVVLAAPTLAPELQDAGATGRRVLQLVNETRSRARRCGWRRFDAAAPLAPSDALRRAALAHARDMAGRSALDHGGSDGSTAGERASRAGYEWLVVGENIAAGQSTPEQVVADWIASPRHCTNLMRGDFSESGIAYATDPGSAAGIYWVQLFAAPRP